MSALFALVATALTSFLPILNKYLLRDTCPAFVVWITNAASLPILALGTVFLTECSITWRGGLLLSCTAQVPHVDEIFVAALLCSAQLGGHLAFNGCSLEGRYLAGESLTHIQSGLHAPHRLAHTR